MNGTTLIFDAKGSRIGIRRPTASDCDEFISLMLASQQFHYPWVDPPKTSERYHEYLKSRTTPTDNGFLLCDCRSGAILGVVNVNCIVRGLFQSAYLGFYIGAAFAKQGYMTEGLKLITEFAFKNLWLHRLEANIQPANLASIATVRKCGFQKEGFSPQYLQVFGQWRDHERWALLAKT